MKVEYTTTTKADDSVAMVANKISKNQATILSRTPGEVVALIPKARGDETTYTWVWLSGFEGAYISEDSSDREALSIAKIIIQGEWQFQPNAKMILEGKG